MTTEAATPVSTEQHPLLEMRDVGKHFGGVTALDHIQLTIGHGEVVALVGDNGAGKSTLSKVIAGVLQPDDGELLVNGTAYRITGPSHARNLGIEVVYQDLALAPNLDITTNLFLGREIVRRGLLGWLNGRRMRSEAKAHLAALDVNVPSLSTPVERLSGGQRQAIAISRATYGGHRLIVMDEPTAALGVRETAKVEELIMRLAQRGISVLLVSHNMAQVKRITNRVLVLRRGRLVAERRTADVTAEDLVSLITGAREGD
ncbi:ATP-binding cassette domain-containing protein [Dactylosporangium sp. NPDC051485]|uniref:ATP-binding cassette domain-containing protein n=1 Tax=Dactylosporangium sp. NPDC051485 TaxID=3154846 RepID=UPI003412092B